jgi:hypothetical protein
VVYPRETEEAIPGGASRLNPPRNHTWMWTSVNELWQLGMLQLFASKYDNIISGAGDLSLEKASALCEIINND